MRRFVNAYVSLWIEKNKFNLGEALTKLKSLTTFSPASVQI